jgi:hypothetical protein
LLPLWRQHHSPVLNVRIQSIPRKNAKAATKRARENDLSLRG